MGLMDKIAAEQERIKPNRCGVSRAMQQLKKADQEQLRDALANYDYAHTVIASVLTAEGYKTTPDAVGRHRKGTCGCARG